MAENNNNGLCCKVLPHFLLSWNWMSLDDNGEVIYVLPHVSNNGNKWKVNFCPSCGAKIKEIKEKDFLAAVNEVT
jgi:hypothetical protein